MVKIVKEQQTTTTKKVMVSVECDKCHTVYHEAEVDKGACINLRDTFEIEEFHHIDFVGGYGSIFGDGSRVQCDLCQHCLKGLIEPFARVSAGH